MHYEKNNSLELFFCYNKFMMDNRKIIGGSGEDIAAEYLEEKGYKIINRNLKVRYGEIDILAEDNDMIVLVEVKTKTIFKQGTPEEMVDYFKKKKLLLLSRAICQQYPDRTVRIDVVAVDLTEIHPKINHIINAIEGK